MVRNNKGGKKAKGMGRKYVGGGQKKLRLAKEDGEVYAAVTKILGNAMVQSKGLDGKDRICIIRQKFRGRGKRDHTIVLGSWILIGARDWETSKKDHLPKCDILEVYNKDDVEELKQTDIDWTPIADVEDKNGQRKVEDNKGIIFVKKKEEEEEEEDEKQVKNTIVLVDCFGEVDFDDL